LLAATAILSGLLFSDVLGSLFSTPAAAAAIYETEAEQAVLDAHNTYRAANGLSQLVRDPALDALARDWTLQMALTEDLSHRPGLAAMIRDQVTIDWEAAGENVGWGPNADWLHDAFVASPPHAANILGNYNRIGVGSTYDDDGDLWITVNFLRGPDLGFVPAPAVPAELQLDAWAVDSQGVVSAVGNADHHGDLATVTLNNPIVDMAPTPTGNGYWLVAADGGIFAFGDATFKGSAGSTPLSASTLGVAAARAPVDPESENGLGYWLFTEHGQVRAYGSAGTGTVNQGTGTRIVDLIPVG